MDILDIPIMGRIESLVMVTNPNTWCISSVYGNRNYVRSKLWIRLALLQFLVFLP